MLFLSLTFDHRVIDGAPAAAFLHAVAGHLEESWWMVASWHATALREGPMPYDTT
jgi:hypothetical protein